MGACGCMSWFCDGVLVVHAGGIDGLQSFGAWTDRGRFQPICLPSDADFGVPPGVAGAARCCRRRPMFCSKCWRAINARSRRWRIFTEVRDVASVAVSEDRSVFTTILFDPDQGLSERIVAETVYGLAAMRLSFRASGTDDFGGSGPSRRPAPADSAPKPLGPRAPKAGV